MDVDSLPDQLKCPICFEVPEGEIFQCKNGHAICPQCSSNLDNCPQCRVSFEEGKIRNRAMESFLEAVRSEPLQIVAIQGVMKQDTGGSSITNLVSSTPSLSEKDSEKKLNGISSSEDHEISSEEEPLKSLQIVTSRLVKQGRFDAAHDFCRQALIETRTAFGGDHINIAIILSMDALIFRDQKRFKEAAQHLHQSLVIREKALGKHHHSLAAPLNNLANCYAQMGQHTEAEPFCRRALQIRETCQGKDHCDVARQLVNLGLLYQPQKKFLQAYKLYHRAVTIFEKSGIQQDGKYFKRVKLEMSSCLSEIRKTYSVGVNHR